MSKLTCISEPPLAASSTPETSPSLSRREVLAGIAGMFGMGCRELLGAPVPAPREGGKQPIALPVIPDEPESAAVIAWLEKHLPALSPKAIRDIVEGLDDDEFATREAASEQLIALAKIASPLVWPLPHLRARRGDMRTPEQLHRLSRFYKTQRHPTRIPPLTGSGKDVLMALAAHAHVSLITMPGNEKHVFERLEKSKVNVPKEKNSFFEVLESITSEAGVSWHILNGSIRLSLSVGKQDARETHISGPFALIKDRKQSAEKHAAVQYALVMEPQQGRIVGIDPCLAAEKGFACRIVAEPGEPTWKTTYTEKPKLIAVPGKECAAQTCVVQVNMATTVRDCMVPLDGTPVDLGGQRFAAKRTDKGIVLAQHAWPTWAWCNSPFTADVEGWMMTDGNRIIIVDAAGKPLASQRVSRSINERIVTAEYAVDGGHAVWVRGPMTVRGEAVSFTMK